MKYNIIISGRVYSMLGSHVRFLARVSPNAAKRLKTKAMKAVRSLETNPERCPFLEAEYIPEGKYRKLLVEKRYLVLYQIRGNTVYVDYIVDCRQDYQWLL